jgi:hypothetical protein
MFALPNNADLWRNRAEEMRALANDTLDLEAKTILLRMAADYDRLAELADRDPSDSK